MMELPGTFLLEYFQTVFRHILWLVLVIGFQSQTSFILGGGVVLTRSKSDLRSISLDWTTLDSQPGGGASTISPTTVTGKTSGSGLSFLVKYCEDNPWDDTPLFCRSFRTNDTRAELRDLRPSTKYLVNVEEEAPTRAGRMLAGTSGSPDSDNDPLTPPSKDHDTTAFLDKASAFAIETQKYTIKNVDCKKGQTDVTIETGEDFEGVISVQKPNGKPDAHCLVRGYGTAQRIYVLPINHTTCAMEYLENGTIMNAVILIQVNALLKNKRRRSSPGRDTECFVEHASLVLGSDRSLRISCNYQPAVIRLETGMGHGSRVIQISSSDDETTNGLGMLSSPSTVPPNLPHRESTMGVRTRGKPTPAAALLHAVTRKVSSNPRRPIQTTTTPYFSVLDGREVSQQSSGFSAEQPLEGQRTDRRKVTPSIDLIKGSRGQSLKMSDMREGGILMPSNSTHEEAADHIASPTSSGISLVQVVAISTASSLAAIIVVCFVIWLIVFREVCSRHRSSKRSNAAEEQLRFG